MTKARIFIGSSSEGLDYADAVQVALCDLAEPTVWNADVFQFSRGTLENLVDLLEEYDFAVFVCSPDDIADIRGEKYMVARDNVVFELGLFMAKLGREKVVFLVPANLPNLHLPSDLDGVTRPSYDPTNKDLVSAVKVALFRFRQGIKKGQPRERERHDLGIREMWRQRREIPNPFWNTFTMSARSEVWLFGIAEQGYAEDRAFHAIVADGTARGCCYRILLLDPDSDAAKRLDIEEGGGQQVQGRIHRALRLFQSIQQQNADNPGRVEIRVCADLPHVNIVRSDSELLVTQYMPPLLGYELLTMRIQTVAEGVFGQYEQYFRKTWDKAKMWGEGK